MAADARYDHDKWENTKAIYEDIVERINDWEPESDSDQLDIEMTHEGYDVDVCIKPRNFKETPYHIDGERFTTIECDIEVWSVHVGVDGDMDDIVTADLEAMLIEKYEPSKKGKQ